MLTINIHRYKAVAFILLAILLSGGGKVAAQTTPIGFSIPDVSVTEKDTFTVTITADSVLTGREVYSYRFYLTYNPSYVEFIGVDETGPVLDAWGLPTVNSSNPGTIRLAGAGSSPLEGAGHMILLKFVSLRTGGTYISFNTTESYLNERNPSSTYDNGYVYMAARSYPNIYPDSYNMFIGDIVQMSVSGGVAPYTYSVVNTDVAVITEQTKVQAINAGTTKVYVTDANGEKSYTSGVFDVRSVRMDIEEQSVWPKDTFYIPVKIEVAPGTEIYSGKIELQHNTAVSGLTNVIVPGDYQAVIQSRETSGVLSVSFASSVPVTGSGVLCYLGFRANASGYHWMRFGEVTFNESLLAWPVKSTYYINVDYLPSLNFSPSSGALMWGDQIQITATGGTAPYTYSTSDPSVATIDVQGNLKAVSGGKIRVSAEDAHGAEGTSGEFTVYDCNVKVNNTDGVLDVDTRVPITVSQLPDGRDIFGFKAELTFDDADLEYVRVDALSSILLEGTLSGNTISVSGASGDGIKSGVIGYVVFRIRNTLPLNATAAVNLTSFSANENTIYTSLTSGFITRVEQVSYRPVANAGADFSVQEGDTVQLNASASYDYDNDQLTYQWTAPSGVTLDDPTSETPVFVAPWVSEDTPLTFTLVVNDGSDDSDPDQVTVTVLQLNQPPVADAGEDKSYLEGSSVSLDGSNSFDPDGDQLSYNWKSLDGIVLFNSTGVSPSFILPQVDQNTEYRFTLVVNDGAVYSAADTVVITALQENKKPVAFAGGDFEVNEGDPASLDGSLSYDDDNDPITYLWTAPPEVTLSSNTVAKPTFTAPAVHRDSILSFILVVNDGNKDSDPDEVLVTVKNIDILSTEAKIDSVMLPGMESFTIDDANSVVSLNMPYGYDVRALAPEFKLSYQASVNPASGSVQDLSMPVYYTVTAEDGTTVRTWKVVVNSPVSTMQRGISAGWNWISLNVRPADMDITSIFGGMTFQELDYVKSTEYSATYYASTGWFGDLVSFPENRTVRMKKGASGQLSVTGEEINPTITSVSMVPGWNSIAYLLRSDAALNDAIVTSSIPAGNVVLKGLNGSSVYFPGTGWSGEIDTLRILEGYKINVEDAGDLLYSAAGAKKSISVARYGREELLDLYGLNPAGYSYSSTLIAEVMSDNGDNIVRAGDLLIAMHGNEVRGVSEARYVDTSGKYVFVLTYYSNAAGEDIIFKLKQDTGDNEYVTGFTVSFSPDEIIGQAVTPRPLFVDEATSIDETPGMTDVMIWPNPVFDVLRISASGPVERVSVFNSMGAKVVELIPNSEKVSIPVQGLAEGIYTVRIKVGNVVVNRKIVKTSK